MDIKEQLKKIIEKYIHNEQDLSQLDDVDAISSLQINSIIFMQIIIEIEDTYQIEFDFDKLDIKYFRSIDSLCEYVKQKIEQKN